jgi:hypothetical protein
VHRGSARRFQTCHEPNKGSCKPEVRDTGFANADATAGFESGRAERALTLGYGNRVLLPFESLHPVGRGKSIAHDRETGNRWNARLPLHLAAPLS